MWNKNVEHVLDQALELILDAKYNFKGSLDDKTTQRNASEEKFELEFENLKNTEEAKNKITHCVHENGRKSKIY